MHVLITNDDGIFAKGLWSLYNAFAQRCKVTVIAPDRERSAVGHGITLHQPIRAERVKMDESGWGYAVSGTPADCIKLGLLELMDHKPDMVVSGINPGANLGVNVNYSGTVAAAKEATLYGIPAIAASISARDPEQYDEAAGFITRLAEQVVNRGLPFGTFLNVNLPDLPVSRTAGVRMSRQGVSFFKEFIEKKTDPRNRPYYWQGCESPPESTGDDVDTTVICDNYVSITPIKCDMTDYDMIQQLESWDIE